MIEDINIFLRNSLQEVYFPQWLINLSIILCAILVGLIIHVITVRLVIPAISKIIDRTPQKFVKLLFSDKVLRRAGYIIPILCVYNIIDSISTPEDMLFYFTLKILVITLITSILVCISGLSSSLLGVSKEIESLKGKSFKGVHQVFQILLILIGITLSFAALANKSPMTLLAGLGASAAVLMLIFKDTILGFVSGIQLSANNMLEVGDWISVPKYGADGDVIEISLNTVKVKNFDNTISMVPPYALVHDSFQNWKAMENSHGRRVTRSINISMQRVTFIDNKMLDKWMNIPTIKPFISEYKKNIIENDTNLSLLRKYIIQYIKSRNDVNHKYLTMVRYLEPEADGLPLELYFFTTGTEWNAHETTQAEIMEHAIAAVQLFDLNIFERAANI